MTAVRIACIALCTGWASLFIIAQRTIPLHDRLYPEVLLAALFVLTVALGVRHVRDTRIHASEPYDYARVAAAIVMLFAYLWLWSPLGFLASTFCFVLGMQLLLGERRPLVAIALPAAVTVVLYVIFFRVVLVPFPEGPLQL